MARRVTCFVLTAALAVAGCTSSRPSPPISVPTPPATAERASTPAPRTVVCPAGGRSALAAVDGGAHVAVAASARRGLTTCTYRVAASGAACTKVELTIDTADQAFVDFNRWVDEQEQNSSIPGQRGLAPQQLDLPALGVEVDWVPGRRTLATGSPGRWVTVRLYCTLPARRALPLALRVARTAR